MVMFLYKQHIIYGKEAVLKCYMQEKPCCILVGPTLWKCKDTGELVHLSVLEVGGF